jgi:ketosteroid isomerase-like protein
MTSRGMRAFHLERENRAGTKDKNMATATSQGTDEQQILTLINDRTAAVCARDVDSSTANIAPDLVWFDVVNPLRHIGSDTLKKRAAEWFASFQGPIVYETRDLSITAGDGVAFSHGLCHVSATKTDGGLLEMWWRTTLCFRKLDGNWMVTHEHNSVPFDAETGGASLDLKP